MENSGDSSLVLQDGSEFPRQLAEEKLRRASAARATLIDEHSAAFRWLMASLLAINGGGLVALADIELPKNFYVGSGASFWIGIVAALGLGWRSQVINRKAMEKLAVVEQVWTTALALGELNSLVAQTADEGLASVKSTSARVFGWLSVAAFSGGVWIAGIGYL
jgi:FtsH-binding integral membrane protein